MNSLGRFLMRASVGETIYEEDVDVPGQDERDALVDKNLGFSGDVEKITEKEFDGGLGLSTEDSSDSTEIKPRLTPGGEKEGKRKPYSEDTSDDSPATFDFMRNTEGAGDHGDRFGQDVEPHGRYVTQGKLPDNLKDDKRYETGSITFNRPKRMNFGNQDYSSPDNWKRKLSEEYGGRKGKDLSQALADDGYDGIMTHDEYGPSETVDLTSFRRKKKQSARVKNSPIWDGGRNVPNERLFGRTKDELDPRLWDENSLLKKDVSTSILDRLDESLKDYDPVTKDGWKDWTRVYFAGSQASFWGGNNDVDILLGINFDKLRRRNIAFESMSDEEISGVITNQLRQKFNNGSWSPDWADDSFELTGFVNPRAWNVEDIRPYAAYEILDEKWYVEPLRMPFWTPSKFPQGPGLWKYLNGMVRAVHGILEMPDPYRSAQAAALWDFIRANRSTAFDEGGHGWYDVPNVLEKYLDQLGLWSELYRLQRAFKSGEYDQGGDWDNDPRNMPLYNESKLASHLMKKHSTMVAIHPPPGVLDHLLPKRRAEDSSRLHLTLCCIEDGHDEGHLAELPDVVEMWAENIDPVDLQVGGVGTFANEGKHVLWASVDHPDLHRLHESLTMYLEEHGYNVKQEYGFTPHITLGYDNTHYRFLPKLDKKVPFTAHDVLVHIGDFPGDEQQVHQVSFGGQNEEG